MTRRQKRREALKVVRIASQNLDVRSGVFMRKLRRKDADAQMAFAMAADEVGVDPTRLQEILEMILEFIRAIMEIFDNWN